jgi:hypothetical protein
LSILRSRPPFPAPANLYCDVEVHDGGMVRSTETFIVPVVPDVSQ